MTARVYGLAESGGSTWHRRRSLAGSVEPPWSSRRPEPRLSLITDRQWSTAGRCCPPERFQPRRHAITPSNPRGPTNRRGTAYGKCPGRYAAAPDYMHPVRVGGELPGGTDE